MVISFLKEDIDCWVHKGGVLISIHGFISVPGPPVILVVICFLIFIVCLDISFFGPLVLPRLLLLTVLLGNANASLVVVLLAIVAPRWPVVVRLAPTPVARLVLVLVPRIVLLVIMVVLVRTLRWLFLHFPRLRLVFFQIIAFFAVILIGPIAGIVAALSIRIT